MCSKFIIILSYFFSSFLFLLKDTCIENKTEWKEEKNTSMWEWKEGSKVTGIIILFCSDNQKREE